MAKNQGMGNGAGEGNRTLVVSLGSVRRQAFLPNFAKSYLEHSRIIASQYPEHQRRLPRRYRTVRAAHLRQQTAALTMKRKVVRHG